ncbi:MAG: NAD(P)H-hydrate epimerase [Elusimicrobiales bacterium]|nr:NAD(P)H-hydrate epimerase [Elusimicrobiales bacterium]
MSKIPEVREYEGWPVVTAEKMKYLDKKASMEYGAAEIDLMENAGKGIADGILNIAKEELSKEPSELKVIICCGRGNNGGDGIVAARHLKEAGVKIEIYLMPPRDSGYSEIVIKNIERAKEKELNITLLENGNIEKFPDIFSDVDIILDALLGVGTIGKPTGIIRKIIQFINKSQKLIVAADIPSGLSPNTGHHSGVFIMAKHTFTLGFPKTGLMAPHAQKNIGSLKVIDIGYPEGLMEEARA